MDLLKKFTPIYILFIVLFLVKVSPYQDILHPKIWYILLFFSFTHFLVLKISEKGFEYNNFITFYLTATVVRMVLVLLFIGAFLYLYPDNRKSFLLTTVVFYLFLSIFEISQLLRNLRRF